MADAARPAYEFKSEITVGISTAIDQQGDATREIARNIQSVAAGSSEISAHIGGVTSAATATGKAASDVLSNARELDNQSGTLRNASVYRGQLHNHAKLTYNEVGAWLDGAGSEPSAFTRLPLLREQLRLQDEAASRSERRTASSI